MRDTAKTTRTNPAKTLQPTPEQQRILDAFLSTKESILIEAMAGCSKTSTIEILARSARIKRPSCYIVFNKKNKEEAERKFRSTSSPWAHLGSASHVNVVTANGLGHNAWSRTIKRRLILNTKKLGEILKQIVQKERSFSPDQFTNTLALTRRARTVGLIPKVYPHKGIIEDTEDSWEAIAAELWLDQLDERCFYFAHKTLCESIRRSYLGEIDFDDQIYMSSLFSGIFPRYPDVFGDEVQDYSPLNQRQLALTAADRLILVGDPRQAIYAFRGADSSSMLSLSKLRSNWLTFPLSITFRCPKVVVERQQNHAEGFQAAPSNEEGTFEDWQSKESWSIKDLEEGEEIAILCRNNAPLLAAAIRCIKAGRGATVLGGEIGKGLISLLRKICPDESTSSGKGITLISEWASKESANHRANEEYEKAALIYDKAGCLYAVLEEAATVQAATSMLEMLFSKDSCHITCSTGHKAKGLEWHTVIHLDPWRIPSKWALQRKGAVLEQELNLKYVIETRAQSRLILANAEQMK